jgi:hypothetical protein
MTRITLTAVLLLAALPAQAFLATNDLVVEADGPVSFHVPYRGASGAPAFWCAAGDYAARVLGASPADRVWRLSEPPRRSGEGIRFSLAPEGRASGTGLAALGPDDASLSVAHALMLCENRLPVRD